jgi:pyrroline-5-carboxylate reductase
MSLSTEPGSNSRSLSEFAGTVILVGAGRMGGALLEGWIALGLDPARIVVIEPEPPAAVAALAAGGLSLNPDALAEPADAVVLAVKPQIAPDIIGRIAAMIAPASVVLSIMAGRTLTFLEGALPRGTAIVRAMPNTPASIGRGITVAVPNDRVGEAQRDLAHALLVATGNVEWIADEDLMDAVTAVSGSGPAYVFLLAESLARAGEAAGLPADFAARLARATVAGSGELMRRSPLDPAQLRQNVTSPGGTTAAALDILMGPDALEALMVRAIAAAARRSRQLAG